MSTKVFASRPVVTGQPVVLDNDPRLPHFTSVTVDFGHASGGEDGTAGATVVAPWVTAFTQLVCVPAGVTTPDHDPHDAAVEGITAYAVDLVAGVGFAVLAHAPNDTWGRYVIHVTG